jgi:hypothetical protein
LAAFPVFGLAEALLGTHFVYPIPPSQTNQNPPVNATRERGRLACLYNQNKKFRNRLEACLAFFTSSCDQLVADAVDGEQKFWFFSTVLSNAASPQDQKNVRLPARNILHFSPPNPTLDA